MTPTDQRNQGLQILLIGEDADYRFHLVQGLSRHHASLSIDHASTKEQAENLLPRVQPDLVVLEDPWHGDAGLSILQSIKHSQPDVLTVLITSPGRQAAVQQAIRWGLDGHLLKTATHKELLPEAIQSLLELGPAPTPATDTGANVLMNRLNVGTFRATLNGKVLEGNPIFLRLLDLSSWDQVRELRLAELFPNPSKRDDLVRALHSAGTFFDGHLSLCRPDNRKIAVSLTAILSTTEEGDQRVVGCVEDLTLRKEWSTGQAQDAAWQLLAQELPIVTWTTDEEFVVTSLDGSPIDGGTEERGRLVGGHIEELFEEEGVRRHVVEAHENALQGEHADFTLPWNDSVLQVHIEPLRDDDQIINGCIGIALDVGNRQVQEPVDPAPPVDDPFRDVFEHSPEAIFVARPDGQIKSCNAALATLLGHASPDDLCDRHVGEFFEERAEATALLEHLRAEGRIEPRPLVLKTKDGQPVHVTVHVAGIQAQEAMTEIVGYLHDETPHRRLEAQLHQSQRLEAVGRLAGGVAHDFNNLLTAINGYATLLLRQVDPDDESYRSAEAIKKAGEQAAALTGQLRAFSRRQVMQPQVFNLDEVIVAMKEMLQHLVSADVDVVLKTSPEVGRVKADRAQIEQVILNLVLNARDAMPNGGRLEITTRVVEIDPETAAQIPGIEAGAYVSMNVRDDGVGMDAETLERIFEPFFTTKPEGEGTGLGLATAIGIVSQCGGGIHATSKPGGGTTFTVYLPRTDSSERRAGAAAEPRETARRVKETILVAEDDENVRALTAKILSMQGYEVLLARSGRETIRKAREHEGRIDLLIADVIMPDFGGRDLAEILVASRPEIKVLYMSAHTDAAISSRGVQTRGPGFLQKPFTPDQLATRVRDLLNGTAVIEGEAEGP